MLPRPIAHVVVVEDDHDMRRDLADFLKLRGFEVSACSTAEEYLALEDGGDLVLLDIGLTGMDGLELLQQLREAPKGPKVVIVSAFGSDEDRVEGLDLGADAYVVKGTSLEVIEATCQAVLRSAARGAGEDAWSIDSESQLRAPNGRTVPMTHQELLFMRRMLVPAESAVTRKSILRDIGKEDTLQNQRNLDNIIARLRRKVLQQTGLELPVRSAYGTGYRYG